MLQSEKIGYRQRPCEMVSNGKHSNSIHKDLGDSFCLNSCYGFGPFFIAQVF